ncbi:Ig-like domain-containing protein [Nonomuraea sp. NPDC050310]|uniref:L,D-transpeptidase n=1 Tax=unclassified Nonomuraea TaxID=2593643 RepID=UPI0033F83E8A
MRVPRLGAVFAAACCVALTACSSVTAETPQAPPPVVTVWPAFDSQRARPDRGLVIRAQGGTLAQVQAHAGGTPVPGRLDPTGTTWRSDWTLAPGTEYSVTAKAAGGQVSTLAAGRFRTRPAPETFKIASVVPAPGETVGVGMPIIVTFDRPIRDRAAVERALEVRAATPVEGAWRWVSDQQAVYRTRHYWAPRQPVRVVAHLTGVRAAPGVFGTADHELEFAVGRKQISTVSTITKQMTVRREGRVVQRMAISAGMATTREYTTTSGVHLTMEKGHPVRMISPGRTKGDPGFYDVLIDHAVRISNSGEYVHAKDNVWAQGRVNVSHGCINSRPDQAAWFFDSSLRGDPVTITGTDRELEWHNGWGFWQLPWDKWIQGSALYDPAPKNGWVEPAPPPPTTTS